jgi:ABC-type arginine transport system ATPase subunit
MGPDCNREFHMSDGTVRKHSQELRRAVKWVSERRQEDPSLTIAQLLAEAGPKFNLSPKDQEGLMLLLREEDKR